MHFVFLAPASTTRVEMQQGEDVIDTAEVFGNLIVHGDRPPVVRAIGDGGTVIAEAIIRPASP
ncbi:MAG: hypothetical protein ACRDWI_12280 [Jiangellaceae bacterium]